MKTYIWLCVCAAVSGLASGPTRSEPISLTSPSAVPPAASITLATALDAAWQRALAARENDGLRRRAEAERAVAAQRWAAPPSLNLSHRDDRLDGNAGRRETEIGVSVPLWLPGQRAARASTADSAVAQAAATELPARLRLAGELREAAWQLAATQAEAEQAQRQVRALAQLAEDVARRVRAGDLARADSLAAEAEQLGASALLTDLQHRVDAAKARWSLLTGLSAFPSLQALTVVENSASMSHPELRLASQSTELSRQRVALMRHSRRDPPELSVALRHDALGRGQGSQASVFVGLRVPFGTDDRNRPLEVAALTEYELAQANELRLRERLDSEARVARDAARSAQIQLDAETARARLLRERAALIDKSFHAGESPLPDLLRALAAAGRADSDVARQTAALGLARARIEQAEGILP